MSGVRAVLTVGVLAVVFAVAYAMGEDSESIECARLDQPSWITRFVHEFAGQ